MRKWIGAVLVIVSCGGGGCLAAGELRRRERQVRNALRMVLRLRTEVCVCRRSLPEALERLRQDQPGAFNGISDFSADLAERPFLTIWEQLARKTAPSGRAYEAFSDLGTELSGGSSPEAAFDRCTAILEEAERQAGEERLKNARLYIVLGFGAGCMLALTAL